MTEDEARAFAHEWIEAWNSHDLDRILSHYAAEIVLLSPGALRRVGNGRIEGIAALRAYSGKVLAAEPHLAFVLDAVRVGFSCLTILYRNHRGQSGAETCEFGPDGTIIRSFACFSS